MGKRGTRCTVCEHKSRHLIELGLVHGTGLRVLGARFQVSWHAIGRHGRSHLSPVQRAAILAAQRPTEIDLDALRTTESEGLLGSLVAQRARLQQHGDLAVTLGDVRAAVAVEGAITSNLALTGKLLGQLVQHHSVTHTNILVSPDYLKLRSTLLQALRPFPEAARAVGAALHRLESDAAKDITPRSALIEHAAAPDVPPIAPPGPPRTRRTAKGTTPSPTVAPLVACPLPQAPPIAPAVAPAPPPPYPPPPRPPC